MSGGIIGAKKQRKKRLDEITSQMPGRIPKPVATKPRPSGDLKGLRAKNPYQGSSTVIPTFKAKPKAVVQPKAKAKPVDRTARIEAISRQQRIERKASNAAREERRRRAMAVLEK